MIQNIVNAIKDKLPITVVSHSNVRNLSLRKVIVRELTDNPESYLATPFIESMFPWTPYVKTIDEMCAEGEIRTTTMRYFDQQLDANGKREINRLYQHQAEAIAAIRQGKSIVVTTGTGSGKTECFLYPILDTLAKEFEETNTNLEGIRALFLYPLNALIESQKTRFEKICNAVDRRIQFAMYNGETPECAQGSKPLERQAELGNRKDIRDTPPQLLITNSTMLEYAMVRNDDKPIFAKSHGKLQFVVLDEAHTYLGSDAAELALRIRRTLLAFGVKPENVRFIATSATVGGKDATKELQNFMASVAGINANNVQVIGGARILPEVLPSQTPLAIRDLLPKLRQQTAPLEWFKNCCKTPQCLELRRLLHQKVRMSLDEVKKSLNLSLDESLELVDYASRAQDDKGNFFLPMKLHIFQRAFSGAWACWSKDCSYKQTELSTSNDWLYGKVYLYQQDQRDRDPKCECGCSLFPVVYCHYCGEPYLTARQKEDNQGHYVLRNPGFDEDSETIENEDSDLDEETKDSKDRGEFKESPALLLPRGDGYANWKQEGEAATTPKIPFFTHHHEIRCCRCQSPIHIPEHLNGLGAFPLGGSSNLRPSRVLAKSLYQALVRDVVDQDTLGRRLLAFTDSRQGTAYNAASQGLHAEMQATRIWLAGSLSSNAFDYSDAISIIESHIQKEMDRFNQDLKIDLQRSISQVFHLPIPEVEQDKLAELFLWRELSFRSRNRRSLETLGLLQVTYTPLERLQIPLPGMIDVETSKNFLHILLDYGFRATGSLEINGWNNESLGACFGSSMNRVGFTPSRYDSPDAPPTLNRIEKICKFYLQTLKASEDWNSIRNIFLESIRILKSLNILNPMGERLKNRSIQLLKPTAVWLCPHTKTLLTTPIQIGDKVYTPYVSGRSNTDFTEIKTGPLAPP